MEIGFVIKYSRASTNNFKLYLSIFHLEFSNLIQSLNEHCNSEQEVLNRAS